MKYIKNTLDFHVEEPTVISLGKFDGIHRGHELLMEKLAQKKEEILKAAIFTFDIPPKKNVEHIEAKVLTTNEEKMHIFEGIGIDYLIECPFTREVMCMEPEDFIRMLVEKLNVKCIVAGEDFHFGHNRRGDYQMLKRYAPVYGYEALILSKMKEDERDISSTFVREEIMAGNIEKANLPLFCDRNGKTRESDRKDDRDSDDQSDPTGGKTSAAFWRLCDRSVYR